MSGLPRYFANGVQNCVPIREGHRDDMRIVGLPALPTVLKSLLQPTAICNLHPRPFAGHLLQLKSNGSAKTENLMKAIPQIPAKLVLPPQWIKQLDYQMFWP